MIQEIENMMSDYWKWLKDSTILKQVSSEWVSIMSPCLDRHNDWLVIYVRQEGRGYFLTDDGYIINDLEICGCSLKSERRQNLLSEIVNGFGVTVKEDQLTVVANPHNFSQMKHNLLQAMLAVNDLYNLSTSRTTACFKEDVTNWLDLREVRYLPDIAFTGKSGYTHNFDIAIPRSKLYPERIVKTINHPDAQSAKSLIFEWEDAVVERPRGSQLYAMLNDESDDVSGKMMDALKEYTIVPLLWSEREEHVSALSS